MRITFLLPNDDLTGGTRVVAVYASELQALGHEVLVVTARPAAPSWREQIRRFRRDPLNFFGKAKHTKGHVAQSGVPHHQIARSGPILSEDVPEADFIVATWWETAVWMNALPPSKGRHVHLIQGYEVWFGAQWIPKVHAALRLPNIKIAISRDLKATIEAELGPLQIEVVGNAVDPRQFNAPQRPRNPVPTVGFVYATAAIKGADICRMACELARKQLPELRVVAFGSESPTAEVPLPVATAYTQQPPQQQLRNIYAACDVWLFGSRLDSFGLPIVEAMACRTPVVAVPVGAAEDLIGHGGGVLVPKESPQAMADAIVSLCTGAETEWQRVSDAAYQTAHRYTWRDAADRLVQILNRPPQ